jgi:hypothetical protein
LLLQELASAEQHVIVRSARVGLSLKKHKLSADPPSYLLRPYRYLTEPRRVSKGKPYLVLSLHAQGISPEQIAAMTGCPRKTVERYLEDFTAGQNEADFAPYFGIDLGPKELCRLHGVWHAKIGSRP